MRRALRGDGAVAFARRGAPCASSQRFDLSAFVDSAVCLLAAFVLGTLIGAERQYRQHSAGLRTNVLVAIGAAAFVDFGSRVGGPGSTQVLAYVVSGIGFLGAGAIMKEGVNVRGLNTAATLWCSAAVGAAAGAALLAEAALLTALVIAGNTLLRPDRQRDQPHPDRRERVGGDLRGAANHRRPRPPPRRARPWSRRWKARIIRSRRRNGASAATKWSTSSRRWWRPRSSLERTRRGRSQAGTRAWRRARDLGEHRDGMSGFSRRWRGVAAAPVIASQTLGSSCAWRLMKR